MPFQIIRNDITNVHADAIVNTANPEPIYASGTDAAIYQAAGAKKLLAERKKIGRLRPGEAAVTPAFRLNAKYIIHTVGPAWIDGEHGELSTLASCYRKSLLLARQLGCRSIAFPLIATGVYGFPKDKALEIALREFSDFLQADETGDSNEANPSEESRPSDAPNSFDEETPAIEDDSEEEEMNITLVVFDRKAFDLSSGLVESVRQYIDENYVDEQHIKEYGSPYDSEGPYAEENRIIELRRRRNMYRPSADYRPSAGSLPEENYRPSADSLPEDYYMSSAGSLPEDSDRREDRVESIRKSDKAPSSRPKADRRRGSRSLGDLLNRLRDKERPQPADGGLPGVEEELAEYELTLGDFPAPSASPKASRPEGDTGQTPVSSSTVQSPRPRHSLQQGDQKETPAPAPAPRPQRSLQDVMSQVGETFTECLLRMIDERGLKDSSVYKRANIDRKLFSKIRCNPDYTPGRRTAIALGIALELNMDEMTDLLRKAGIALSPGSKFDLIIRYCVENHIYNIIEINTILFDYDQAQLG